MGIELFLRMKRESAAAVLFSLIFTACGGQPPADKNTSTGLLSAAPKPSVVVVKPSPVPDQVSISQSAAVSRLDSEIESLQNALEDDRSTDDIADIDTRIAQNQSTIAELNLEASLQHSSQSDELQAIRSRQTQDSAILNRQLADLERQIDAQGKALAATLQDSTAIVAPQDSQIMQDAQVRIAQATAAYNDLQAQYQALQQAQYQSPDLNYYEQTQALEASRNRQIDLVRMVGSLQEENIQLAQQKTSITNRHQEREKQLQQLRVERDRELGRARGESRVTTPSGNSPSGNSPTSAAP